MLKQLYDCPYINWINVSSCGVVVEHRPHGQAAVGSILAGCCTFSVSLLCRSLHQDMHYYQFSLKK